MTEPIPAAPVPSSPAPAATADPVVGAAAREAAQPTAGARAIGRLFATAVAIGTMVVIVAVAVLLMTTPVYLHGALDRAGSAGYLGYTSAKTYAVSDATVAELLLGPGTFVDPPLGDGRIFFYDAAEVSHLRDARTVLYGLLVLAGSLASRCWRSASPAVAASHATGGRSPPDRVSSPWPSSSSAPSSSSPSTPPSPSSTRSSSRAATGPSTSPRNGSCSSIPSRSGRRSRRPSAS